MSAYKKYREQIAKVGPFEARVFTKMQVLLSYCNEAERQMVLLNTLLLMKERETTNDTEAL